VDREGRLYIACRRAEIKAGGVGEPLSGHDCGLAAGAPTVSIPPTLVSAMQDKRIVSVATSARHCLSLSAVGEVYSWGDGECGELGHAEGDARTGPRLIETLERVESIAAGFGSTSAAVDDRGRLFTWGRARWDGAHTPPTGLGYKLATKCQPTPRRVDALSEGRVVGVSLGYEFTLAVTDSGAVFSFGQSEYGVLGHGDFSTSEVLQRRIEALAETGRRCVAETAGYNHALALTEEGQVYGWGHWATNGHGQSQPTPQPVAGLERVKLLYVHDNSSCAVTEKGELYTWGDIGYPNNFNLGHGVGSPQETPKRVEALRRVKVATAAICGTHTLVAGEDGEVWPSEQDARP